MPFGLSAGITLIVGVGIIAAGCMWVAHIGESFAESTELMIDYVNGDEKSGEKLELKAAVHVIKEKRFLSLLPDFFML